MMAKEHAEYLEELSQQILHSVANPSAASRRAHALLFPLFMLLRGLREVDGTLDPTKSLLLEQMRVKGDKLGFLSVSRSSGLAEKHGDLLRISARDARFTPYLDELWSDALLCLNAVTLRNYRGANIALRCMLEDLYRHLYYKDHPQEYGAMRFDPLARDAFQPSPSDLRGYLKAAPYLEYLHSLGLGLTAKTSPSESDIFGLSEKLYADLSGHVHSSKLGAMNSFRSNSEIVVDKRKGEAVCEVLSSFVKLAIVFMVSAHSNDFGGFDDYDKSIVLMGISGAERHGLRSALGV